jgi:hypothetical protein
MVTAPPEELPPLPPAKAGAARERTIRPTSKIFFILPSSREKFKITARKTVKFYRNR